MQSIFTEGIRSDPVSSFNHVIQELTSGTVFFFFFSMLQLSFLFILAMLGFRGYVGFSLVAISQGYSPVAEHGSRVCRLQ